MEIETANQMETVQPGQELLIAGAVGRKGMKIIAAAKTADLQQWFSNPYIDSIQLKNDIPLKIDVKQFHSIGITAWEQVAEGGLYTALWNLSGRFQVGIEFDLKRIPMDQAVIEVSERYQLNPYRLLSGECFVLVGNHSYEIIKAFQHMGISCAVIGKINAGIKREVYHGEERGFLDRPKKDELKKVVPSYFVRKSD